MKGCNIRDCESGASFVYCPNRFTFEEMADINLALYLVPETIENFIESVKDPNELPKDARYIYDNGKKIIKAMDKLEKKVTRLLKNALENDEEENGKRA